MSERRGLYVTWEKSGEIRAIGEIAPLPGYSSYSLQYALDTLKKHHTTIEKLCDNASTLEAWDSHLSRIDLPPPVRFGLDTLFITHQAIYRNSTCQHLLFENPHSSISLNGTLGIQEKEQFFQKAKQLYKRGFRTFKCKVGHQFEREYALLEEFRNTYPAITLRIDANANWSLNESVDFLNKLEPLKIQYCEQPIAANRWKELSQLSREASIPIALDESISNLNTFDHVIENKAAPYVIIKPMRLGPVDQIIKLCQKARKNGIIIVFSSLLDTSIARHMYAVLASGLSESTTVHGLATGSLFKYDLARLDDYISEGILHLPEHVDQLNALLSEIKPANFTPLT